MSFLINQYRFGSQRWTPSLINTALWFDANDSSTITQSGGSVSQWNDKSGNARHATQGTVANQPLYQANTVNSSTMPSLLFDGTNDVLSATLSTGLSGSFAFAAVVVPLRNQAIEGYFVSEVSSYSNYWWLLGRGGGGAGQKMGVSMFDGTNNPISENTTLPTLSTAYIMVSVRDTVARKLYYYENGTIYGNVTDTTSLTPPTYSAFRIGGQTNQSSRYGNVRVCEMVAMSSLPSTTTRQLMEGYLAWKWGLTGSLPSDHPYKVLAPPA